MRRGMAAASKLSSASPLGRDIYGAQQHAPLLGPTITLPDAP